MSYPRVVTDIEKLKNNANKILTLCHENNIKVALVGKCIVETPEIMTPLLSLGFDMIADSRESNLESVHSPLPKMLLRIGIPDNAQRIVTCSDISLQSEPITLQALQNEAKKTHKPHKVILMIDLGDLREGIMFYDTALILKTAEYIINASHLELYGIGTNLTCYGSIVPDEKNLQELVNVTELIESTFHVKIPIIAGGNSSSLQLVKQHRIPRDINLLRIGEAVFLGTNTASGKTFHNLYNDAFILEAEVVEVQKKPSFPIGTRSVDAFGKVQEYQDRGIINRAILAIGKQDVPFDGLIPCNPEIEIIGGSSDHLIVSYDSDSFSLQVGSIVRFRLKYNALLALFTSKYVEKTFK